MLVMQEPMNTSSILSPATSGQQLDVVRAFGQARIGSLMSARSISITAAYSASAAFSSAVAPAIFHRPDAAFQGARIVAGRRSSTSSGDVRFQVFGDRLLIQLNRATGGRTLLPADASDSSNACSTFSFGRPSISGCGRRRCSSCPSSQRSAGPALIAYSGIALPDRAG